MSLTRIPLVHDFKEIVCGVVFCDMRLDLCVVDCGLCVGCSVSCLRGIIKQPQIN